jgi:hypothetical protein
VLELALSMLVMNLGGISPAQAVADGTVNCGTSGTFTIVSNEVTTNTNCQGSLSIPEGVTSIKRDAFNVGPDRSSYITSIVFPNSLATINESAFRAASRLTSIDFGTGIQSIVHWNFADSVALTSVTIPSSVTSIGVGVFYGSTLLESVTFLGNAPSVNSNAFNGLKVGAVANVSSSATGFGANGSTWKYLRVSVAPAAPAFTLSSSSETRIVNTASNGFMINSTGGTIASFSISPSAPAGMSFNTTTGAFTGTPTSAASAISYVITATNASGSATATFTLTVSAAAVVDNSAAQAAAAAKREAEKRAARVGIYENFIYYNTPTIQQFNTAEIYGVTINNYSFVTKEIQYLMWKYNTMSVLPYQNVMASLRDYNANNLFWDYRTNTFLRDESATALSWNQNSTMLVVENVVKKYSIMDSICQPGKFSQYTAFDLSSVGLIPFKNKTIITYNLRQIPSYQRDDYYKITTLIKEEYALIQRRNQRLAKVLSWKLKYSKQVGSFLP